MLSFIVLHYKNIGETLECLQSIKTHILEDDYNIVVVDNNSLIKKEKKQILKYTKDIICLNSNMGYAKANNQAIKYAQKKYNSDFYCIINNDIVITQHDFIKEIEKCYKKYKFDMMGGKINSPSGESVNPFPVIYGKQNVLVQIEKCKRLIKIYRIGILYFLLNIYLKMKYVFKKKIIPSNGQKFMKNVALHGCAIIFSKKYIKKYSFPFYNDTFLFHEEEFLYKRMKDDNLISIYDPNLVVYHKEGTSVKKEQKKIWKSKLFREKERLVSLKLLLKEYDKEVKL